MDLLSALSLALGVFLVGLVAVAMLVAGWELLRQRELLDQLRRDRAVYAATSPLPLAVALSRPSVGVGAPAASQASAASTRSTGPAVAPAGAAAVATRRDAAWTETRPMVLSFAPAADDDSVPRPRELDLTLD